MTLAPQGQVLFLPHSIGPTQADSQADYEYGREIEGNTHVQCVLTVSAQTLPKQWDPSYKEAPEETEIGHKGGSHIRVTWAYMGQKMTFKQESKLLHL